MTPVSILQEKMQKLGQLPLYNTINCNSDGEIPLFKCEVTANNKTSSACGKSKKEAKQNAAEMLLRLLQCEIDETNYKNEAIVENVGENFVGKLQTYCQRKMISLPIYEAVHLLDSSQFSFEIRCTLMNQQTVGKSYCKKEAKQLAAKEMVVKVERDGILKEQCLKTVRETKSCGTSAEQKEMSATKLNIPDIKNYTRPENPVIKTSYEFGNGLQSKVFINSSDSLSSSFGGLRIERKKKRSWNCVHNKELGGVTEPCYLCRQAFKGLTLFQRSGLSVADVHEKLRKKKMSVNEALLVFKDSDDDFFDHVDNISELFDTVVNELDFVYVVEFSSSSRKNESLCCIKIKDLHNAKFVGYADSTQASFKKAVINTLRSMSSLLKSTGIVDGD